jgi:SAM-dependent methyltransferase
MSVKDVLAHPAVYQAFQEIGGFYGARLKAIRKYLELQAGSKIIDIGCGPGYMARDLPSGLNYVGFDVDQRYIEFANAHFSTRGQFYCRFFDDASAEEFGPADIIMMNGVLHHMSDADVAPTLRAIRRALRPGGVLFTLDGVYVEGQPRFAKFMLDHDRGKFIRTADGYEALLRENFPIVETHIHGDLARVPCTLLIGVSRNRD